MDKNRFEFVILFSFPFSPSHPEAEVTVYRSVVSTFILPPLAMVLLLLLPPPRLLSPFQPLSSSSHTFTSILSSKRNYMTLFSTLPSWNEYTVNTHIHTRTHSLLSRISVFHDGLILGTQYRMCHIKRYIIFTPVIL